MNRIWLGIGILTLGGVAAAQVQRESQPSLGTVAKATREAKAKAAATTPEHKPPAKAGGPTKATPDQKSATTTAKKYTNEDLYVRPRPSAGASSSPSSSTAFPATYRTRPATGSASNSADRGKDEAYWRSRAEPVRRSLQEYTDRLKVAKKQQEALKAKQGLDVAVANGQSSPNTYEVQRLANYVMELEGQVRRYEGAMKSLEDEGRRAGALPGWFR
jgi:hypothetical protein